MAVFADNVVQKSNITGIGSFTLEAAPVGSDGFVTRHGTGTQVFYTAQRLDGQKKEFGIGTITSGTPDSLSRDTVIASTAVGNSKVDWQVADQPIFIYTSPPGSFLEKLYHHRDDVFADTGLVNALVASPSPKWTAYIDGNSIRIRVGITNTSSTVTANVSNIGALSVKMPDGSNPSIGGLLSGSIVRLVYSSSTNTLVVDGMSFLSTAGGTLTGPLSVPAGAAGAQVPQAQEVVGKTGAQSMAGPLTLTAGVVTSPSPITANNFGAVTPDSGGRVLLKSAVNGTIGDIGLLVGEPTFPNRVFLWSFGDNRRILFDLGAVAAGTAPQGHHDSNFPRFESAEQSITPGTIISISHGLGARPRHAWLVLRNKTSEGGWSPNDELYYTGGSQSGVADINTILATNATSVAIMAPISGVRIVNVSGQIITITPANWRFVVRANP